MTTNPPSAASPAVAKAGYFRWLICALIFYATTVNYVDRQILGLLATDLKKTFDWNDIDYSNVVFAFQFAYAIGLFTVGRLIDRLGVKLGYALSLIVWSLAAMAHAACGLAPQYSVLTFAAARFALGFAEAGNFPSAIKAISEWFPKKERAFATGVFNAGTNLGVIVASLIVPWLALQQDWRWGFITQGWQWAFIATGAIGLSWLIFWLPLYRRPEEHPRVSAAELNYIRSDPPDPEAKVPWLLLLKHRQTWAFAIAKFMTDPIWWMYLYWVPDFLHKRHGIDLKTMGPPLIAIYLISDVGSVAGGFLSSFLIKRGFSINRGRKLAMLVCALCVVPIIFATQVQSVWTAVLLIGLAAAAHQGWSANVFTMASDMFPRKAIGSVVGIGGMAGAIGGMFVAKAVGYILEWTGSYWIPFIIAGGAYLLALGLVQLLAPRLEPARLEE